MTTDRTKWLDEQILAAVWAEPMSTTKQICEAICKECRTSASGHYHCYSRVYSRLRALAKKGDILWRDWCDQERGKPYGCTLWEPANPASDVVEGLEAMWALPSAER